MSAGTTAPLRARRRLTATLLALLVALVPAFSFPSTAAAAGSPIVFTDISFQNDTFASGTSQRLNVEWEIEGEAQNPVTVSLAMPAGISVGNDRFAMTGPDGEAAGECVIQNNTITCTADPDFIEENPYEVSGTFWIHVTVTEANIETVHKTYTFGEYANEVTLYRNVNWCDENCEYDRQWGGKWGWYDNLWDEIVWGVTLPAGQQGMAVGQSVTVVDTMDPDDYTLIRDAGYPKVWEARSIAYNSWGRESLQWAELDPSLFTVSEDGLTVSFTTRAGRGSDWHGNGKQCTLNDGTVTNCVRGTDGAFYEVRWYTEVNTPGELQPNGNRVFYNSAEYTIEGETTVIENSTTTRYASGATVVGRNFGKFQVTKEFTGDTTLNPVFTVTYTYTEPGQDPVTVTKNFRAGDSFTSPEMFKGTTVTINEIRPTDPANVTWADPVFVDSDGNEVTELTFSVDNGNLGKITKLTLKNRATLNQGNFQARKAVVNPDGVPLADDLTYTLEYTWPADAAKGIPAGSGTLVLPANGAVATSGAIPIGAHLSLREISLPNVPGATWDEPVLSQSSLVVGSNDQPTITVTNRLTQDLGQFRVTKSTSGDGQELIPEGTEFTVSYEYGAINGFPAGSGEITVAAGETSDPSGDIPAGATVTVTEVAPVDPEGATWGTPEFSQTSFVLTRGQVLTLDLDNPITWNDGNFSVVKVVEGDGAYLVDAEVAFTVDYTYELPEGLDADPATGSGSLTVLNNGEAVASDPLPYGTTVTLSEVTPPAVPGGTWIGSSFSESTFTIGDQTTYAVTLTNTIEEDLGSFSVTKSVSGAGDHLAQDGDTFLVDWSYPAGPTYEGDSGQVTVTLGGEPAVVEDIPTGAIVTLTEVAPTNPVGGTYGDVTWTEGNVVTIGKNTVVEVGLDNALALNTGQFSVKKVVDGDAAHLVGAEEQFVVAYSYPAGEGFEAGEGSITVLNDGQAVPSQPLPFGAEVTLSEFTTPAVEGGTWIAAEFDQQTFTIGDGTVIEVTLTNTIELDLGSLAITKSVSGDGSHLVNDGETFTVQWSHPEGPAYEAASGEVEVTAGGEPALIERLPAGAEVTLTEVTPDHPEGGSWGEPVWTESNVVTIEKDVVIEVGLENTIGLNSGQFSVTKIVDGSGAGLVDEDTSFTVEYSYPAGDGFEAGSGTLEVRADGTAVVSDELPYGAVVTLTEVAPADVAGGGWTGSRFSTDTVTIGDGTVVEVTLTNTIEADPEVPVDPQKPTAPTKPIRLPDTGSPTVAVAAIALAALGGALVWATRRRNS